LDGSKVARICRGLWLDRRNFFRSLMDEGRMFEADRACVFKYFPFHLDLYIKNLLYETSAPLAPKSRTSFTSTSLHDAEIAKDTKS